MKKVLVIYFSQSGQLHRAITATLRDIMNDPQVKVTTEELKPRVPFPFPWSYMQFFDAFPETVQGIPCEMEPYTFPHGENYDLVVIAYQPWFLSVSRPVDSFLQSKEAEQLRAMRLSILPVSASVRLMTFSELWWKVPVEHAFGPKTGPLYNRK